MRCLITFLAAPVIWSVLAAGQQPATPQPYNDQDAYEIYSLLLPQQGSAHMGNGNVVIQRETKPVTLSGSETQPCLTAAQEDEFRDAVADYNLTNRVVWLLQSNRLRGKSYSIVDAASIKELFNEGDGWSKFHTVYPHSGGYIQFSAVGFDKARTRAIVYVTDSCGEVCGAWGAYLLRKLDRKWQVLPGFTCGGIS